MATTTENGIGLITRYLYTRIYVKIEIDSINSSIYYNTVTYEILSIVPYEYISEIPVLLEFSDYVSIVTDSSNAIEYPDEKIGIMYIDTKAPSDDEKIIIARLPFLNEVIAEKRTAFLNTTPLKERFRPFWEYYRLNPISSTNESNPVSKNIKNGKILVERGIQKYCKDNNMEPDEIKDLNTLLGYIVNDIFKYKLTVTEDQQLHEEADHPDTIYPEVTLKLMVKMGLLE